jgi:hypothetical protein
MTFTVVALAMVAVVVLWVMFRYYPEKKAAERFFDALVAGDTAKAYALWQPGPSYVMKDFLADWGPKGYYGPVKSYKIIRLNTPHGANVVAVEVSVSPYSPMPEVADVEKNSKTRVVDVWILPSDKSFSFSPNTQ